MPDEAYYREIIGLDIQTNAPELLSQIDTQLTKLEARLVSFGAAFVSTMSTVEKSFQRTLSTTGGTTVGPVQEKDVTTLMRYGQVMTDLPKPINAATEAYFRQGAAIAALNEQLVRSLGLAGEMRVMTTAPQLSVGAVPRLLGSGETRQRAEEYAMRAKLSQSMGESYLNVGTGPGTMAAVSPEESSALSAEYDKLQARLWQAEMTANTELISRVRERTQKRMAEIDNILHPTQESVAGVGTWAPDVTLTGHQKPPNLPGVYGWTMMEPTGRGGRVTRGAYLPGGGSLASANIEDLVGQYGAAQNGPATDWLKPRIDRYSYLVNKDRIAEEMASRAPYFNPQGTPGAMNYGTYQGAPLDELAALNARRMAQTRAAYEPPTNIGQRLAIDKLGVDYNQYMQMAQSAPKLTAEFEKQAIASLSVQQRLKLLSDTSLTTADRQALLSQQTQHAGMNMWRQSFILFGLALGIQSFVKEIETATGQKLPPFTHALSDSLRVMSDFGMTGAMIGGPQGMLVGAGIGAVVGGLTALASQTAEVQNLNQAMDSLTNKGDVIETLSQVMGWTRADAEWAMVAAKNNYALADSLDRVAKAKEPPTGLERLTAFFETKSVGAFTSTDEEFRTKYWTGPQAASTQATQQRELEQELAVTRFMAPTAKLRTTLEGYAQGKDTAVLAETVGWTDKYAKSVLEAAAAVPTLGKQLLMGVDNINAYRLAIENAKKNGEEFAGIEDALALEIARVTAASQEGLQSFGLMTAKAGVQVGAQWSPAIGGLEISKMSQAELNREMQIANTLADQEIAALTRAGIPTKDLTDKWANTVRMIMLANGQIEIQTGKTAALASAAQQLMNAYNKPVIQSVPELNAGRAGELRSWLTQYENLFRKLGVKQEPQEYLLFGQNGGLYRFFTSSEAMTLALQLLAEEVQKERDALKDNNSLLRGHYNIPTDFGYQPPTAWEYYDKTKSTEMGPVNYPWNFPQGTGKNDRYYLGGVPTGEAGFFGTTFGNAVTSFDLAVAKFANAVAPIAQTDTIRPFKERLNRWEREDAQTANRPLWIPEWSARAEPETNRTMPTFTGEGRAGTPQPTGSPETMGSSSAIAIPFFNLIAAAAKKYGIDTLTLAGVIKAESGFNPNAINKVSGATGLGQVMPSDAPGYGRTFAGRPTTEQLKDPATNVDWAARILSDSLKRYGDPRGYFGIGRDAQGTTTETALARYNAAIGSLRQGMQVQGVPQMTSSLQQISQQSQIINTNTAMLRSMIMPLASQVMLQIQMVGLLSRMIPLLGRIPTVTVPVTVIGGGATVQAGTPKITKVGNTQQGITNVGGSNTDRND